MAFVLPAGFIVTQHPKHGITPRRGEDNHPHGPAAIVIQARSSRINNDPKISLKGVHHAGLVHHQFTHGYALGQG